MFLIILVYVDDFLEQIPLNQILIRLRTIYINHLELKMLHMLKTFLGLKLLDHYMVPMLINIDIPWIFLKMQVY